MQSNPIRARTLDDWTKGLPWEKELPVDAVVATEVTLAPETLVRSCIVLPNVSPPGGEQQLTGQKSLSKNSANQVLL
jgi:hypothetical protein